MFSDAISNERKFWLFCAMTFVSFVTVSMLSYLSVILSDIGYGSEQLGLLLAFPLVPTLVGMFLSGELSSRFGVLFCVKSGVLLMLAGYLAQAVCIKNFEAMLLIRGTHGLGYGVFFPAAMMYAKQIVPKEQLVYYFGIYSCMIPTPNLIGPWIAEKLYAVCSVESYFLLTAIPLLIGGLGIWALINQCGATFNNAQKRESYAAVFANNRAFIPLVGIFCVGIIYGFIPSYMALFLKQKAVSVSLFFSSFTAVLLICRFYLLRFVSNVDKTLLVALGFFLMACSYLIADLSAFYGGIIASGAVFGVGYSVAYPNLSVYLALCFPEEQRGKPIAVFNMLFFSGIYLTPLCGGMIIEHSSTSFFLGVLGTVSLLCALGVGAMYCASKWKRCC